MQDKKKQQMMENYPSLAEGNGLENRQACKSVRGFESHVFRHKLQETLFGVFSIWKGYENKVILFENEFFGNAWKQFQQKK